jgi:hypothetical protein
VLVEGLAEILAEIFPKVSESVSRNYWLIDKLLID